MNIEAIARICHENNRAICEAFGDFSQKPWDDAPEWQRKSSADGVQWRLDNLDAPVSAQHEAWMIAKLTDGWAFGETKDPVAKTHPCLVPFERLSPSQQVKDYTFTAIVRAYAATRPRPEPVSAPA